MWCSRATNFFVLRTENTINVTIAEHPEEDLTEIILFDPSLGTEAPRIYLCSTAMYNKLDHDSIKHQINSAKRNSVPITANFVRETVNKAKADFLLTRLVITQYSVGSKLITVDLQDVKVKSTIATLLRDKPSSVVPYNGVRPEKQT